MFMTADLIRCISFELSVIVFRSNFKYFSILLKQYVYDCHIRLIFFAVNIIMSELMNPCLIDVHNFL